MKVKDLIIELQKHPDYLEVTFIDAMMGDYLQIMSVSKKTVKRTMCHSKVFYEVTDVATDPVENVIVIDDRPEGD